MAQETLKTLINDTVLALLNCSTKKACQEIWETRLNSLKSHITPEGTPITDNTLRTAVSRVRKGIIDNAKPTKRHGKLVYWLTKEPISSLSGNEAHLGLVVVGKEIAVRSNKQKQSALLQRVSERKTLKGIDGLIKECEGLLNSWDWRDLAVAISLLTGRRAIEVLKTGSLSAPKHNTAKFSGQAKSKAPKPYRIPTLSKPSKINNAIKRLRQIKDLSSVENSEVNQIAHVALDRRTSKLLKAYTTEKATMHDLRRIYASYCVKHIMPKGIITDSEGNQATNQRVFLQAILGHENTGTGLHYETWEVQ